MSVHEFKKALLAPDTVTGGAIEAELARNREARRRAVEEAKQDFDTPLFSARDLGVVQRAATKVTAHRTEEKAEAELERELLVERAFDVLADDDPVAAEWAAEGLFEEARDELPEFLQSWGAVDPRAALRFAEEALARGEREEEQSRFLAQAKAAAVAEAKKAELVSSAAEVLKEQPDREALQPVIDTLVETNADELDRRITSPEEAKLAMKGMVGFAREQRRQERLGEFKRQFMDASVFSEPPEEREEREQLPPDLAREVVERRTAEARERALQPVRAREDAAAEFKRELLHDPIGEEMERWRLSEVEGPE
jgi:hypothetical protein